MPSMTGRCRGKPRLKVLLFGWQNPRSYGGIQSFVRDLRLASPAHLAFHVFPEDLFDCAFEVARGRFRRGKFVKRLAAFLQDGDFAVVHSHNLHFEARAHLAWLVERAAASARIPHVLTIHDLPDIPAVCAGVAELERTFLVTQSRYNQRTIRNLTGRKAEVIPVGIDFRRFADSPDRAPDCIVFPGRLTPAKGAADAVVVAELARRRGKMSLLFSYPTEETAGFLAGLRRLLAQFPLVRARFMGRRAIPGIYQRAAVTLALPLAAGGFGLAALESLACGRPVVACPTGGMTEWLESAAGALVVRQRVLDPIVGALEEVLDDWQRWRTAAHQGRQTLEQRYDIRHIAAAHYELYTRLRGG